MSILVFCVEKREIWEEERTHTRPPRRLSERLRQLQARTRPREMEQQARNDRPARRVSSDANLALRNPKVVDEVMVSSEGFEELGRVDVLGRESVVEEEDGKLDAEFEVDEFGELVVEGDAGAGDVVGETTT